MTTQHTTDYARIEQAIHYLNEHFQEQPELNALAEHLGLSEYHLQRLFRRWAGISPKRFVQMLTAGYARERLSQSAGILDTAYAAGLSGPGRLHDLTVNIFALTPGEIKAGGADVTITTGIHPTPFGEALIALTERGVCGLQFLVNGDAAAAGAALRAEWPGATLRQNQAETAPVMAAIFGHGQDQRISLLLRGTNFQVRVWEALLRIPAGALVTYGDVAAHLGQPGASRAVGTAIGRNPVAFLIPCHRVIRSTGILGEYRWESARKQAIIAWEAAPGAR